MSYSQNLLDNIEKAKLLLEQMITNAEKQNARNFQMLYSLQNALKELEIKRLQNGKIDSSFMSKWDEIMGWIPRVFEGHSMLRIIRSIDEEITFSMR